MMTIKLLCNHLPSLNISLHINNNTLPISLFSTFLLSNPNFQKPSSTQTPFYFAFCKSLYYQTLLKKNLVMAPKKAIASKSSTSTQLPHISQLIKDGNIPSAIKIRPLTAEEENIQWILSFDDNLLVLGKRHIETIHIPIHPIILQFLSSLQILSMQLTLNSFKFIVAVVILNEVEGKGITINDLLFTINVKKTTSKSKPQETSYLLPFCL